MNKDENSMIDQSEPKEPVKEENEADSPKYPNWEYRTEVKIVNTMKDIIHKTLEATKSEVDSLRKKLDKLQYGG